MSRSLGGTWLTTRPPIAISPPLMFSSPAIMRSSVDLPQPEGPTSTVNEPSAMSMSTPCSTSTSPKRLCTDRMRDAGHRRRSVDPASGATLRIAARTRCMMHRITMSIDVQPTLPQSPSTPARLVAERLSDRLAARLAPADRRAATLQPGDRLPSEQQLAGPHGVSRTVVREAVHQLQVARPGALAPGLRRVRRRPRAAHRAAGLRPQGAGVDRGGGAGGRGAPRARRRDGGAGGRARHAHADRPMRSVRCSHRRR